MRLHALGHPGQQRLQLGRGHRPAADLDELLEPVDDDHVAVAVVDRAGRLADGWTVPEAADWVWARAQPATFSHLVDGRGWPADAYTDRAVGSILSEVVGPGR